MNYVQKPKFLAKTCIKLFHLNIFVILRVNLIKKYECQNQAFFSVFQCFLDHRVLKCKTLNWPASKPFLFSKKKNIRNERYFFLRLNIFLFLLQPKLQLQHFQMYFLHTNSMCWLFWKMNVSFLTTITGFTLKVFSYGEEKTLVDK